MNILDRVEKEEIRDLLGKGWLTHDGMWFYHVYMELGIEKANTLNKAAIKSLAPIEVHRAKKILRKEKQNFHTFDELIQFMFEALELILPESIFQKSHFNILQKGLVQWQWENGECFAYKGAKAIGISDEYCCGVIYRIKCWLDALGIKNEFIPEIDKCMMHERGECRGLIKILLDDKDQTK